MNELEGNKNREAFELNRIAATAAREMSFPAIIESVPKAIEFLENSLEELGYPLKIQTKLAVVIDEIFSNIAKFAYGSSTGNVTICILAEKDGCVVDVSFIDEGTAFNPLEAPQTDAEEAIANGKIGGQGIVIVRKIADEIEYERKDGKNILRIRKLIER